MTYPVADFLIQIKNAYMASKNDVSFPYSKMVLAIGKILKEEGYVKDVKEATIDGHKTVAVTLKYSKNTPAMTEVSIVSKPSIHRYVGKNNIKKAATKFETAIVSTNQGVMTNKKAIKLGIGGELLAKVS